MMLSEMLAMNHRLDVAILQEAYEACVRKLRLFPAAVPVVLTGAAHVNGFGSPAYTLCGSEVAFKQISSVEGVALLEEYNDAYTPASLIIGNPSGEGFGISDFYDMNDEFTTTPEIFWMDSTLVCSNLDEAFFWLTGYIYPYFVTAGDPYVLEHRYSIQWMVDTYGADGLTVDPVLIYPVTPQALGFAHRSIGDVVTTSGLEGMAVSLVDIYNTNFDLARASYRSAQGTIEANEL